MNQIDLGRDQEGKTFKCDLDDRVSVDAGIDFLERSLIEIKDQMSKAKVREATEKRPIDRSWFQKAETAARIKGSMHQRLQRRRGELRRMSNSAIVGEKRQADAVEKRFLEIARRRLHPDTFNEIFEEARSEA